MDKRILIILVLFLFSAASSSAMVRQVSGPQGSYTVVDTRDYPIIFIPGIAGSVLSVGGQDLWPGSLSTNDEAFKGLTLDSDGQTPTYGTRALATDVIRYGLGDTYMVLGDWRSRPIYQGFYDYMRSQNYTYTLGGGNGRVFYDFPYDFRQDNRRWTTLLNQKVDKALAETKSDKVILFAHSMGGYQARLYMKNPEYAKKIAAVVFMGTPHHGSPMAFWAMTEGYNFGNGKLTDKRMWEISGNWQGGYQLLPDYPFIQDNVSGKFWSLEQTYSQNWISDQEYQHYLDAKKTDPSATVSPGPQNSEFATTSLAFHNDLGNSVDKYSGVQYFMIEGVNQDTVQYLIATLEDVGLGKPVLHLSKFKSTHGDGTVPTAGARIEGVDGSYTVVSDHGSIPSNTDAQNILTQIRKQVLREDERNLRVSKMRKYAGDRLGEMDSWNQPAQTGSGEESLASAIFQMIMTGNPDEVKIKLRDELRGQALALASDAQANVLIDGQEELYLVVKDRKITDAGAGVVQSPTVTINVDNMDTFNRVTGGQLDLAQAYKAGKITFKGQSLIENLKYKLMEWIAKYVAPLINIG